jgi:quinol monooxygenase YgiN
MPLVSVTRLRIRSAWFLPAFFLYAMRSLQQARAAPGVLKAEVFNDAALTFWTCSVWEDQQAMRAYMISGVHSQAMKRLAHWCDEASVVHWEQDSAAMPTWETAWQRMQRDGRPSRVDHPSAAHQDFKIAPLRK